MNIEITNDFIKKSLLRKDKLTGKMKVVENTNARIIKENEENQKEFEAIMSQLRREDEKVRPHLRKEKEKLNIGEFESVSRVYLGKEGEEEGKIMIEIADRLEEFKIHFKKEQEKENEQHNNSDTEKGAGVSNPDTKEPTKGN